MRPWLALALACWLLPAWAQTAPPVQKKGARPAPVKAQTAQKAHRKATAEQVRKFNELQKKQAAKR